MEKIGTIQSTWRYPVKSMRGESADAVYCDFAGVFGDRMYALKDPQGYAGFPWLTGRELRSLVLYTPTFRNAAAASAPPHLKAAEDIAPGVTPRYPQPDELLLDVTTPEGVTYSIDDPELCASLARRLGMPAAPELLRSDRALTDARPLSLFSVQTAAQLSTEVGSEVDPRRFRANLYLDLPELGAFGEDTLVGKTLQVGDRVQLTVVARDARCAMVTLDPDTGESNARVLREIAQRHETMAGVYGAVLRSGMVKPGDAVILQG